MRRKLRPATVAVAVVGANLLVAAAAAAFTATPAESTAAAATGTPAGNDGSMNDDGTEGGGTAETDSPVEDEASRDAGDGNDASTPGQSGFGIVVAALAPIAAVGYAVRRVD